VIHLAAAGGRGAVGFPDKQTNGKRDRNASAPEAKLPAPRRVYVELDLTEAAPGFWGVEFPKAEADAKVNLPEAGEAAARCGSGDYGGRVRAVSASAGRSGSGAAQARSRGAEITSEMIARHAIRTADREAPVRDAATFGKRTGKS